MLRGQSAVLKSLSLDVNETECVRTNIDANTQVWAKNVQNDTCTPNQHHVAEDLEQILMRRRRSTVVDSLKSEGIMKTWRSDRK